MSERVTKATRSNRLTMMKWSFCSAATLKKHCLIRKMVMFVDQQRLSAQARALSVVHEQLNHRRTQKESSKGSKSHTHTGSDDEGEGPRIVVVHIHIVYVRMAQAIMVMVLVFRQSKRWSVD